jgi:hypothetical protein
VDPGRHADGRLSGAGEQVATFAGFLAGIARTAALASPVAASIIAIDKKHRAAKISISFASENAPHAGRDSASPLRLAIA